MHLRLEPRRPDDPAFDGPFGPRCNALADTLSRDIQSPGNPLGGGADSISDLTSTGGWVVSLGLKGPGEAGEASVVMMRDTACARPKRPAA